jgi:hypothetical protein
VAVPQKVKHRITMWPSNFTPRYIQESNKNTCPHKNLYTNVHDSVINIAKCPSTVDREMKDGSIPNTGLVFGNEKE